MPGSRILSFEDILRNRLRAEAPARDHDQNTQRSLHPSQDFLNIHSFHMPPRPSGQRGPQPAKAEKKKISSQQKAPPPLLTRAPSSFSAAEALAFSELCKLGARITQQEGLSEESLKREWRRLAIEMHPDQNRAPNSHERFLRLKEAFELCKAALSRSAKCA